MDLRDFNEVYYNNGSIDEDRQQYRDKADEVIRYRNDKARKDPDGKSVRKVSECRRFCV